MAFLFLSDPRIHLPSLYLGLFEDKDEDEYENLAED
jgi:hypothetical protein